MISVIKEYYPSKTPNKVTRGERLLEQMAKKGSITEDGKNWLIAATDPFHDSPVSMQGWPDVESASSVVRCIKKSLPLKSPLGSGAYDAHVVVWPQTTGTFNRSITRVNNIITDRTGGSVPTFGDVQVFFQAAGTPIDFSTATTSVILPLDNEYLTGACRLIGMGFEIHNSTAELYKSGTCTVYRQPESSKFPSESWTLLDVLDGVTGTHAPSTISAHKIRMPPVSVEEAMLLNGSLQWEASQGCYVVCAFTGADNPVTLPEYVQPLLENPAFDEQYGAVNTAYVFTPELLTGTLPPTAPLACELRRVWPIHQAGAIFSELTEQSTLNLTVHWYIESFPTADEKDIVVLATPSACYDPVALEVFSRAMADLPVGVRVKENGLGDWFADIVADVGPVLAPILSGLNPLAGMAATAATKFATDYRTKRDQNRSQEQTIRNKRELDKMYDDDERNMKFMNSYLKKINPNRKVTDEMSTDYVDYGEEIRNQVNQMRLNGAQPSKLVKKVFKL